MRVHSCPGAVRVHRCTGARSAVAGLRIVAQVFRESGDGDGRPFGEIEAAGRLSVGQELAVDSLDESVLNLPHRAAGDIEEAGEFYVGRTREPLGDIAGDGTGRSPQLIAEPTVARNRRLDRRLVDKLSQIASQLPRDKVLKALRTHCAGLVHAGCHS